jgi:hypothetical protein
MTMMIGVPRRNTKINLLQGPLLGPCFLGAEQNGWRHSRHGQTNPRLDACKRELLSFPASGCDNQVDALSQLLTWAERRTSIIPRQGSYSARP